MSVVGPDVSFWQDNNATPRGIDFSKVRQRGPFVIIRAGQNAWPDPDFKTNWAAAKYAGLARGAYWYLDNRVSPESQAGIFADLLRHDPGELPAFADIEHSVAGAYSGPANWRKFIVELQRLLPEHEIGIYTRASYWREYASGDTSWFGQFPLWVAHYGVTTPALPTPWSAWMFHQFTEDGPGLEWGAESNSIDLNYFNGDLARFKARFPFTPYVPPPVPDEETSEPIPGVQYHRVFRFNSWCHITDEVAGQWVIPPFKLRTTSQAARDLGAQLVINGGDYTPYHATGLHVSAGRQYQAQVEYQPFVHFTERSEASIRDWDAAGTKFHALAGKRIIVDGGKVATRTSAAWYEVHPRTLIGVTATGSLVKAVIDGRQPGYSAGVNLFDGAAIMAHFGCWRAIDLDGGGSSTMVINGKVVNRPIDEGVPGQERLVGTHVASIYNAVAPGVLRAEAIFADETMTFV